MASVSAFVAGVVALIRMIPAIESLFQQVVALYVAGCQKATLTKIEDATALCLRATTDAERYAGADAWRAALSSERVQN